MTPKLPAHDIFEFPLLQNKSLFTKFTFLFSQWLIHPVKRRLSRLYLGLLQRFTDIKVIGITGSAGKSTTAQMLYSILKNQGKTIATLPGLDSVYNIPNTILRTPWGTKYLILEMSVEYPGEMDYYLWLAKPDIGVITNIFPTHLEFLGSIEGVLKEKGKLVLNLTKNNVAFLNAGDLHLKSLSKNLKSKVIWFNTDSDPLVQNSLAASAVATHLGVTPELIKNGISSYKRPPHRLDIIILGSGAMVLDDTYSSNPKSASSALKYFNKIAKGIKIAVLGDMRELADYEESAHREIGREVAKSNFEIVIGVGMSSKFLIEEVNKISPKTKTYLFPKAEEVFPILKPELKNGRSILVKGSRSIGLDKLVAKLS